jgi:hypothetical protein
MPAPARPSAGAFATLHLVDMYYVLRKNPNLETIAQAPTRAGAGIFSKFCFTQSFLNEL